MIHPDIEREEERESNEVIDSNKACQDNTVKQCHSIQLSFMCTDWLVKVHERSFNPNILERKSSFTIDIAVPGKLMDVLKRPGLFHPPPTAKVLKNYSVKS